MAEEPSIHNPVTGEKWRRGSGAWAPVARILKGGASSGRHPPAHRHPHQERVTAVSGRVCVRVGKDVRECGPGESAFLPRGVWHDFWVGDEPAETIGAAEPALRIELILATLAGLAEEGRTDRRGRPQLLQGAVTGAFFGEVWASSARRRH